MSSQSLCFSLLILALTQFPALSQERVLPENLGERVIAVVPLIGDGSAKDPKRPLFVPGRDEKVDRSSFVSITVLAVSDDGKSVIVEFVVRDSKALDSITKANRADVRAFIRGKDKKEDIDRELKRYKRDFTVDAITKR